MDSFSLVYYDKKPGETDFSFPTIIEKLNAVTNVVILFQELRLTLVPYTSLTMWIALMEE